MATIATRENPELSPARKQLVEAQTLMPNTRGWGRSRRPNVTPLDKVATINSTISVLSIRSPENQRLEKSEPLLGLTILGKDVSGTVLAESRELFLSQIVSLLLHEKIPRFFQSLAWVISFPECDPETRSGGRSTGGAETNRRRLQFDRDMSGLQNR